jgi:hypothetical protein
MLSINWMPHAAKAEKYVELFAKEHDVLGRCAKYPEIASAAVDTIHYCKIVEYSERKTGENLDPITMKKELVEKYQAFIDACDNYIKRLP